MESPPTPEIDDWLGSLDRRLGSTPALASPVPVHPPAEAPSRDTVTLASDAVGAAASPEQVDELANRPGAQFDALQKSRADLAKFQEEIHAFHASCAEITEVAGKLAVDRTAFEGFVQRVADFQQRLPGLDSEMDSISTKWSVAKKAVTVLGKQTDRLEDRFGQLLILLAPGRAGASIPRSDTLISVRVLV